MGAQFLNPMILVKKGGKLPEGHIQSWFWEKGNLKDCLPLKLPAGAHHQPQSTIWSGCLHVCAFANWAPSVQGPACSLIQ